MDRIGAFVGAPQVLAVGSEVGPLAGTTLAVKDLFDVVGSVTGAGNPDFAAGRPPAGSSATAVTALVAAGATVVGKTITDELAYSLAGTNVHFGTPINVAAPGRVPGGSSAGSAAAVAAGLVDLALGTDTGGSIRVPASYCGTHGWRPSHGAVAMDGVVPLAPSFDTAGLFARDPSLLATAAGALLGAGPGPTPTAPARLVLLAEPLEIVAPDVAADVRRIARLLDPEAAEVELQLDLEEAATAFRHLQGREAWESHGRWIEQDRPSFGPGIGARFEAASQVTDAQVAAGRLVRSQVAETVRDLTAGGAVLVMPAAAGAAPPTRADASSHQEQRIRTLRLTSLAGLSGTPVVVAPLLRCEGLPFGVAFVGAPGSDLSLLHLVASLVGGRQT
ncbi:amidase [soil metagenome]